MNPFRKLFGPKQTTAAAQAEFRQKLHEVELPDIRVRGVTLAQEARSYEALHAKLHEFLADTLQPVRSESAAIRYFSNRLGLDEHRRKAVTYGGAHDVFRPIISISRIGDVTYRSWVAPEAALGKGDNVLVVWVRHSVRPLFLICSLLPSGKFMAFFVHDNEVTRELFMGSGVQH